MSKKLDNTSKAEGRTYGGLKLAERKHKRRQQFLQAGIDVFGTTGFRSATVKKICKAAKLTDRYFYESFGSLENLLMACYEQCMRDLKRIILRSILVEYSKSNVNQAIAAGLDSYFKQLENSKIARICMLELEGISADVNILYHSYIENFSNMLISLAKKSFSAWDFTSEQQKIIGICLVGAMRQSATNWLLTDYKTDRKVLVSTTSLLFLGLLK